MNRIAPVLALLLTASGCGRQPGTARVMVSFAEVGAPAHTLNTATLTITSNLDQTPADESFAVDDVLVMIR